MSGFINVEAMDRAASRMENAAQEARRQADRIEEATHKLTLLLGEGYGNNAERLIEALSAAEARAQAGKDT